MIIFFIFFLFLHPSIPVTVSWVKTELPHESTVTVTCLLDIDHFLPLQSQNDLLPLTVVVILVSSSSSICLVLHFLSHSMLSRSGVSYLANLSLPPSAPLCLYPSPLPLSLFLLLSLSQFFPSNSLIISEIFLVLLSRIEQLFIDCLLCRRQSPRHCNQRGLRSLLW